MKIAIIGSGWYGCHLSLFLLEKGHHIRVFEKNKDFFLGASGHNTNRLHLGFHYPRSKQTRIENIRCYNKFVSQYKNIIYSKKHNLYGVSKIDSYLDWETYKDILDSSGLVYEEINPEEFGFSNLQGALLCEEAFVNHLKAKTFFKQNLNNYVSFNCEISDDYKIKNNSTEHLEDFDLIIDCTYGSLGSFEHLNFKHELIQLPILEDRYLKSDISFAIMDGKFQSLSPYSDEVDNLYYLYDVEYSPIFSSVDYKEVSIEYRKLQNQKDILFEKNIFEKASYYYPDFNKRFSKIGNVTVIRTTLLNADANRSIQYERDGKVIKILSGKISSVFEAEEMIMQQIEAPKLVI